MTLRLGDSGSEVRDWQQALFARGHALIADGVFGKRTHNATLAFQAAHGLAPTGIVDNAALQVMLAPPPATEPRPALLPHTIPFVRARFYRSSPRSAVELIVLHCMEAAETSTTAERCADYMAHLPISAGEKSAHYYVDSDTVVQGVQDHQIAFAAPGANHNGIQIEHAGYARQTLPEWLDPFSRRMLGLSAQLSARLCHRWKIPAAYVPAAQLELRKRGITTHHEVSKAFGKSSHTDPGPHFPIHWYVAQVRQHLQALEPVV